MKLPKTGAMAQLLINARQSGQPTLIVPDEIAPVDAAEAYEIQDFVSEALGLVGGWKVGAKGPHSPPTCAPLPASLIYVSPVSLRSGKYGMRGVESEIAVRIDKDLPPRYEPYSTDEVIASVGSVHPALEIVSSRYSPSMRPNPLLGLADALSNAGFVYGRGRTESIAIDQTRQPVELYINGKLVEAVVGGNPAGDIWPLITWVANHVAERDGGLRAGQMITTGSCTGLLYAEPGAVVKAVFPGLGEVELTFEDSSATYLKP